MALFTLSVLEPWSGTRATTDLALCAGFWPLPLVQTQLLGMAQKSVFSCVQPHRINRAPGPFISFSFTVSFIHYQLHL